MLNSALICVALCAQAPAPATPAPATEAVSPAAEAAAPTTEAAAVDVTADQPPPSTWDKQRVAHGDGDSVESVGDEQSLLGQVGRTLLGLLVVVGLIYILGKIAIAKLGKAGIGGRGGKHLRVVERLQLDQRNALHMVQVVNGPLLLVGSGEKGVQLITELDAHAAANANTGQSFSDVMQQAAERERGGAPPATSGEAKEAAKETKCPA